MSALTHRLRKLETQIKPDPNCSLCGYPATWQMRVVETDHCDPLPTCARCGRALDHDGMPLGTHYKRIIRSPHA